MSKRSVLVICAAVFSSMFIAAGLFAGTTVKDTFKMESKIYTKHTYAAPTLTHKKHVDTYKAKCGDCHHDSKGKPLANLKAGANVQKCSECHKKPGKKPSGGAKLTDQQKREYHAEAVHDNCIGCHKDFNKKAGKDAGKKAPVGCNDCHPGGKLK